MKLAVFSIAGKRGVGIVDPAEGTVAPFDLPTTESDCGILAIIDRQANGDELPGTLEAVPLAQVVIEAPIPRPRRNIFCVGKNYRALDFSAVQVAVPQHPMVFSKLPETVIGSGVPIEIEPAISSAIDYEVELGVIIGKSGRGITADEALDYVWGYTIINDVTARDLVTRYSQCLVGKSQDTFCPMGPWAVTRDDVDLSNTNLRCWVNDELRQQSNISQQIFDVPTIIETIAAGITLLPGDVIATGTPAGVGASFDPPKYLRDGDVVRMEIDGLGMLENPLRERNTAAESLSA